MAKVTGPLMSLSASGQVAGTIVFSRWKGTSYVRELVIPVNPQSADQGDNRMIVGGIGRAAAAVKATSDYEAQMIALNKIPSGQSKQSALVSYIKSHYCTNATAFEAMYTAYNGHTAKTDFDANAADAGLVDFTISYKGTTSSFKAGLMLYLLAKAAIDYGFTGSPYTTALASWTDTEIAAMVADFAPAAYLNGTEKVDSFKWMLTERVGTKNKIYGYLGPKFLELVMTTHHFFKGTYLSYASPKLTRKGRATMLFLWPFDKGVRKAAAYMLKNPFRLFKKAHLQTVMVIQPVDFMQDGRQSMCDGCPDITVWNGDLVWSCRLEEQKQFGTFLRSVTKR